MVPPEGLLSAIERSSIPFQLLFVLPLILKYYGHVVDIVECGGMALPEGRLFAVEGPSVPLQRLFVLSLLVEYPG
jgi:hypothetical protein